MNGRGIRVCQHTSSSRWIATDSLQMTWNGEFITHTHSHREWMWLSDNPLRSGHRPPHLQNALSSQACGPPLPIWSRAEGIIKNIYLAHTEIPMLWVYLHLPLSDTAIIYFDGMADAGDTTTRNGAPHLDYDVIIIG